MTQTLRYPKPQILAQIPLKHHAVIEASAGTGKTYTLEHLIIEIMLKPEARVGVEEILVVTYTERATSELRSRVRALLERILTTRPEDVELKPGDAFWEIDESTRLYLESQVYAFDRAPIHTIHGFCRRILSENAFYLRKLFDQTHEDSSHLFERAFHKALRTEIAVESPLKELLEHWLSRHSFEELQRGLYVVCTTPADIRPKFNFHDLERALTQLHERRDAEWQGLESLASNSVPTDFMEAQEIAMEMFKVAEDFVKGRPIPDLLVSVDHRVEGWQRLRKVNGLRNRCPALDTMLLEFPPLKAAVLQAFAPRVMAAHIREKERGFYDFDDMLTTVWERMKDPSDPTASALIQFLRMRYKYALVDEFQDTDEVQWNIFKTLFFDSPTNRLYVIGDPKQAIYGFRGADVHTYLQAKEQMAKRSPVVPLKQNFRSTPRVIQAYNAVFNQNDRNPFFDAQKISYDEPVEPGKEFLRALDKHGNDIVPFSMVRLDKGGEKIYGDDLFDSYGHYIADEILKILGDEPIFLQDEGELRRVGPSDIFVLARTRREEHRIGEVFRERGVPFAFYKLEGLFATPEAAEVLDVLRAIDEPHLEDRRIKAWMTHFFEVDIEDLGRCRDLPETHPIFDRLIRWSELAQARDFERLFIDILDRSGIVRREIFDRHSERELTNYQHIFELLLEASHGSNTAFKDLIETLSSWVSGTKHAGDDDRDIQRLESERDAVQIMTFHKSKGLEADVVFLFGGISRSSFDEFTTLHWGHRRILHIGKPYAPKAIELARHEIAEEDRRLLYVGITRARARIVVPFASRAKDIHKFDGMMRMLNDRLISMQRSRTLNELLFEEITIFPWDENAPRVLPPRIVRQEIQLDTLKAFNQDLRPKSFVISSYSRMKRFTGGYKATAADDLGGTAEPFEAEPAQIPSAWRKEEELPGGAIQGVFLHQILEDLEYFAEPLALDEWRSLPATTKVFDTNFKRYAIDPTYRNYCETIVHATLSAQIELPDSKTMPRLGQASRVLKEVEFMFPIPEGDRALDIRPDGPFRIERGWIKGFIDLLFEYDSKIYFADWKSDTLENYSKDLLELHVAKNYGTQASLYGLAVARMLRLHSKEEYDARFGGYLYFFLRGMNGEEGVWAARPEFEELLNYESELVAAPIY